MKKILIIGAGFLQDFVIRKAKELGYYTIAIDGNPDAIGFSHADKSSIINIIDQEECYKFACQERIDGVLTAATDYGVLSASYIADKMGLPGLKYETAKRIKNKYEVRRRLLEAHVDDTQDAYEITEQTDLSLPIHYPVIVKPCDGSGSRATTKVNNQIELENACKTAISSSLIKKAMIETFFTGHEYGAESLVVNGEVHVLAIMKKWMTNPPYYAELGHQIPCELPIDVEKKAIEYVERAINVLEINHGAVNMDLIISDSGEIHIVDVGARMGGNMIGPCVIPIGTGIPYMENLIKIAVGDDPDWSIGKRQRITTRLLAFKEGIVESLPDFDMLEKEYNVKIYHHMKIGDHIHEYHTNLDGCGYIIAKDSYTADKVLTEINKCIR